MHLICAPVDPNECNLMATMSSFMGSGLFYFPYQSTTQPPLVVHNDANQRNDAPLPVPMFDDDFGDIFTPDMLYDLPGTGDLTTEDVLAFLSQPPPQPEVKRESVTMEVKNATEELRREDFTFTLDAPISIAQRKEDGSLTYVNKGQLYTMRTRYNGNLGRREVRTSLFLLFQGEQKPSEREGYWRYWREQQPQPETARALDVDLSQCIGIKDVSYPAFNGIEFTWIPSVGCVIRFCVNCLSTDFTPQKGVKGIALKVQADLWPATNSVPAPLYRGYCHIKVFRDKGAERKHKDEQKTAEKRLMKYAREAEKRHVDRNIDPFFQPSTTTTLNSVIPTGPRPSELYANMFANNPISTSNIRRESSANDLTLTPPISNLPRSSSHPCNGSFTPASPTTIDPGSCPPMHPADDGSPRHSESISTTTSEQSNISRNQYKRRGDSALTVYLRSEEEEAYNALFLENPCLSELKTKICDRYSINAKDVRRVFKRTRKGLLIKVDDSVVARLEDESDFILEFDRNYGNDEVAIILVPGEGIE